MKYETAGDPISGLKWTRKTTQKIAKQLRCLGIAVSRNTVGRLLRTMNFSLRVNHKKIAHGSGIHRDAQFRYIAKLRKKFAAQGSPTISVDSKKKELIGQFKNPGRTWQLQPLPVNDHDFRSLATGWGIPYGVLDSPANRGTIFLGTSRDTPQFAVESIAQWWRTEGRRRYPQADHLYILADGGGSNGPRCRAWKQGIQQKLCDAHQITVTVSHYPPGTSKWNPIEHRLFSEISKNWAGRPLDSYETVLNYCRTTNTSTGLRVTAHLVTKQYEAGVKISDSQMRALCTRPHATLPQWNYTLVPRENGK